MSEGSPCNTCTRAGCPCTRRSGSHAASVEMAGSAQQLRMSFLLMSVGLLCPRWAMMLPASIQVCPIELPGRGRRRDETGIAGVAILADALAESLPLQVTLTANE